jgi:hypothetical protein
MLAKLATVPHTHFHQATDVTAWPNTSRLASLARKKETTMEKNHSMPEPAQADGLELAKQELDGAVLRVARAAQDYFADDCNECHAELGVALKQWRAATNAFLSALSPNGPRSLADVRNARIIAGQVRS